jgi:hypothetical protein
LIIRMPRTKKRGLDTVAVRDSIHAIFVAGRRASRNAISNGRATTKRGARGRVGADLTASTLLAAHDTERLFEFAKHAYIAVHHSR